MAVARQQQQESKQEEGSKVGLKYVVGGSSFSSPKRNAIPIAIKETDSPASSNCSNNK